nr:hypothetical protein [Tanacetum cinerariifolium]
GPPQVELLYQRLQAAQGRRFTEQITLHVIAAMLTEEFQLRGRFDAFGHDLEVQGVGHEDDRLNDFHVLRRFRDVDDERPVDLDRVQRKALEIGQGGIARAEVVDGQAHAQRANAIEQHDGVADVAHQRVFGHLQLKAVRGDVGIAQRTRDLIHEFVARQIQGGAVHR